MMPFADFSQMAVTGEHLVAAHCRRRIVESVVFPTSDGGCHGNSPYFGDQSLCCWRYGEQIPVRF
jgi:hypothetical protein